MIRDLCKCGIDMVRDYSVPVQFKLGDDFDDTESECYVIVTKPWVCPKCGKKFWIETTYREDYLIDDIRERE